MRNDVLDRFISGKFDYAEFEINLSAYHVVYDSQRDYDNCEPVIGAIYYNQWEAVAATGKDGIIESCQGWLKRKFLKVENINI